MENLEKKPNKPIEKEHFKVIVNGREKVSPKREPSYEDIVKLAFNNPVFGNPLIVYTITYKLPQTCTEGSLVQGKTVKIEAGMIFNVTKTDKS